jgi:hypothetical protein
MLCFEDESQILMVGEDMDVSTEEHTTKFFESSDNGKEFLFRGCIVLLGFVQFSTEVSDSSAVLHDASTELEIGGIGVDVKPFVMIRVCRKSIRRHQITHFVECVLMSIHPMDGGAFLKTGLISKRL